MSTNRGLFRLSLSEEVNYIIYNIYQKNEKYVQIAKMAKMGWWESDLKNQEYICSDFIVCSCFLFYIIS